MADHLRLTYRADDDGTGEVTATASAQGWSGRSSGYVNDFRLTDLASALRQYPLSSEEPPRLVTGYGSEDQGDEFRTIDLQVVPIGSHGQVVADIHLATFVWPGDRVPIGPSAHIVLPTSYQRVAEFADQLDGLRDGRQEAAVLLGETLL